jgi:DnaA-homolog protein
LNQLALPLTLADHAHFESFHDTGNEGLVAFLRELAGGGPAYRAPADRGATDRAPGPGCWIWGAPATGKSHLLQAVCERMGDDSAYVPLALLADADASVLDGLARRRCVCLDDIDRVAGNADFELALFELGNQLIDNDGILVVSADAAPREVGIALPDLQSRLSRLPVFHIEPLDEQGRIGALQLRAGQRGLELPPETARYLLSRSRRDMASLYGLLDRLDVAALKAQRRLTIPFVRDTLLQAES